LDGGIGPKVGKKVIGGGLGLPNYFQGRPYYWNFFIIGSKGGTRKGSLPKRIGPLRRGLGNWLLG